MSVKVREVDRGDVNVGSAWVYSSLRSGDVVILRGVPEILEIREQLLAAVGRQFSSADRDALEHLFGERFIPRAESLAAFVSVLKQAYVCRFVSAALVELVTDMGLPGPVSLEGGIHRLVFPVETTEALRQRENLFGPEDFSRPRSGAMPETFLTAWSPPHRDIGRPHYTFQANLWFPLHDLAAEETLIIFPEVYRQPVPIRYRPADWRSLYETSDLRQWDFGEPTRIPLRFGDAILFHGEQVHCSPIDLPHTVRLSYDFRIAARCDDSNVSYRETFWNQNNFLPAVTKRTESQGYRAALGRADSLLRLAEPPVDNEAPELINGRQTELTAQHHSFWLAKNLATLPLETVAETARLFERFPFAEDRCLALASALLERDLTLVAALLRTVLEQTRSFFWAARAGDIAHLAGLQPLSLGAYQRCAELAEAATVSFDDNPFDYWTGDEMTTYGGRLQPLPEEFAMVARSHLAARRAESDAPSGETLLGRLMPWAPGL